MLFGVISQFQIEKLLPVTSTGKQYVSVLTHAELQSKQREVKEGAPQTRTRPLAQRQTSLTETFQQKLQQYPGSNF